MRSGSQPDGKPRLSGYRTSRPDRPSPGAVGGPCSSRRTSRGRRGRGTRARRMALMVASVPEETSSTSNRRIGDVIAAASSTSCASRAVAGPRAARRRRPAPRGGAWPRMRRAKGATKSRYERPSSPQPRAFQRRDEPRLAAERSESAHGAVDAQGMRCYASASSRRERVQRSRPAIDRGRPRRRPNRPCADGSGARPATSPGGRAPHAT